MRDAAAIYGSKLICSPHPIPRFAIMRAKIFTALKYQQFEPTKLEI